MYNIIAFVGVSGSGKTCAAASLELSHPEYFCVPQSFTTRERRGSEDTYVFLDAGQYNRIHDCLIGRTNFNNKQYGTLLANADKCNLLILDINALDDLFLNGKNISSVKVIFLTRTDYEKISQSRPDRSLDFIIAEAALNNDKVIELCNKYLPPSNLLIHDVTKNGWLQIEDIIEKLIPDLNSDINPSSRCTNQD